MLFPHVARRVFNTPVAIHPGKAAVILAGVGERIVGRHVSVDGDAPAEHVARGKQRKEAGRLGDPLAREIRPEHVLTRAGPVAVISIEGTLIHKGRWLDTDSGETSYEGLWTQVRAAQASPSVRGVVFEVDSFGGEISGVFDLADAIFELSAAKPTIAILTDHAYSAGYLLASAARSIVMPSTGGCGSIGVVELHVNYAKSLADAGVKVTVLAAGKHKADGNPFQKLAPSVANRISGQLEALRLEMALAIGRYRSASISAEDVLDTEGRDFDASDDPVAMGLVDAVARPSKALEAFIAELNESAEQG